MTTIIRSLVLLSVVVTPTFINLFSHAVFEPEKASALLILGIALVFAAAATFLAQYHAYEKNCLRKLSTLNLPWHTVAPLLLVVSLLAVLFISSLYSLNPWLAFVGSYKRAFGFVTFATIVTVFFASWFYFRSESSRNALLESILVGCLPVLAYALMQRSGVDWIVWGGPTSRISSTLGNPILLGGYLVLIVPLALGLGVHAFSMSNDNWSRRFRVAGYLGVAVVGSAVVLFTGSRGPLVGGGVGVVLFLLLMAPRIPRRRFIAVGTSSVVLLVVTAVFASSLPGNRSVFRRLESIVTATDAPVQLRIMRWNAAASGFRAWLSGPVAGHDQSERLHSFRALRVLIGHGPENISNALERYYEAAFDETEYRQNRTHNFTWDVLVTSGSVGLFFWYSLLGILYWIALRQLGLLRSRAAAQWFALSIVGSTLAGFLACVSSRIGVGGFGLVLTIGVIGGTFVYILGLVLRKRIPQRSELPPLRDAAIVCGILGSITAHWVEIQFSFPSITSSLLFFVLAALLVATEQNIEQTEEASEGKDEPVDSSKFVTTVAVSGSMATAFIALQPLPSGSVSFLAVYINGLFNSYVGLLVFVPWLFWQIVTTVPKTSWRFVPVAMFFVVTAPFTHRLSQLTAGSSPQTTELLSRVAGLSNLPFWFFSMLIVGVLGVGLLSAKTSNKWSPRLSLIGVAMTILTLTISYRSVWYPNTADVFFKSGEGLWSVGKTDAARLAYEEALKRRPRQAQYYTLIAERYFSQARRGVHPPLLTALLAERAFELSLQARHLKPYDFHLAANPARIMAWRAGRTEDETERRYRGAYAQHLYEQAQKLNPANDSLLYEQALLQYSVLKNFGHAKEFAEAALSLNPNNDSARALIREITQSSQ